MSKKPKVRVPETVLERADELAEEYDYASRGEAIRHMCRSGEEFDV